MEEASENAPTNVKLIKLDSSIARSSVNCSIGSTIPHQMKQQVTESSSMQGDTQALQKGEPIINDLQQRLKESQEDIASLFTSLETETRNNAEIRSKLNITWETIESIRECINYINESRLSFEQRRVNSSALYENVIQKQKEAIEKLQLDNALKTKDLKNHVMQLKNELQLREKRLQEAIDYREQKNMQIKTAESLYENMQAKHAEEVSALKSDYEIQLLELRNTNSLLETEVIDIRKENTALNMSLVKIRTENSNLKENLEQKLEERKLTESVDDPKSEGQVNKMQKLR